MADDVYLSRYMPALCDIKCLSASWRCVLTQQQQANPVFMDESCPYIYIYKLHF